jgi:hypothetical protein
MPKKVDKNENKNSVVLMYAVLGALIFMLGIIIVMKFFI